MKGNDLNERNFSPFSAEQLREQMEAYKQRASKRVPNREISERGKQYLQGFTYEKVEAELPKLVSPNEIKPEIKPWLPYKNAKWLLFDHMRQISKAEGFDLVFYQDLKEVCEIFAAYFSGNQVEGLDPHKGLFLFGNCGCGKTRLFMAAQRMALECGIKARLFKRIDTENLIESYSDFTDFKNGNWLFDDLGAGEMIKIIDRKKSNPMQVILSARHRKMFVQYQVTHVTTNIRPTGFSAYFDERVCSRMDQMFNYIPITGPDFREQKPTN